jgi:hypothetical protein
MSAHHKTSDAGVGHTNPNPTAGLVGDRAYQYYFVTPELWRNAMELAKTLESKGMYRRAWRVRLNLDGEQPEFSKTPFKVKELSEAEKKARHKDQKRLHFLKTQYEKIQIEFNSLKDLGFPKSSMDATNKLYKRKQKRLHALKVDISILEEKLEEYNHE